MNPDFLCNSVEKQKLKFNIYKYKAIKAEHENTKLGHFMKRFTLKPKICSLPSKKKKK